MDYEQFLKGLRLRYFEPHEILNYANRTRGGVRNAHPPEDLWQNIVPTLWVVDHLRHALGKPITLTSIYRSPAYNDAVGGAPRSRHLYNNAIDFQVSGMSPAAVRDRLEVLRSSGMFKGGIGTYATFTHVDTRGVNKDW